MASSRSRLAWVLAKPVGLGPTGEFVTVLAGFSTVAVMSALLFRRGTWKRSAR